MSILPSDTFTTHKKHQGHDVELLRLLHSELVIVLVSLQLQNHTPSVLLSTHPDSYSLANILLFLIQSGKK